MVHVSRLSCSTCKNKKGSIQIPDSQSHPQEQGWHATLQFLSLRRISFFPPKMPPPPINGEAADFMSRSLFIPHTSSIFDAVTFSLKTFLKLPCVMETRSEPPAQRSSSTVSRRSADVAPTLPPVVSSPFRSAQSLKQPDVQI